MKTIRIILATLVIALASCGGDETDKSTSNPDAKEASVASDNSTPEGVGKMITDYVIANDYNGLANLIITHDEMAKAIGGSNASPEGKDFAISRVDAEIKEMQVDIKTGLDEIRASGTTAGIVWDNCKFKEARPTINESRGFQMMTLKCVIESNGQEHVFTVTDIVGTDNGWKLGGKMMFGDIQSQ